MTTGIRMEIRAAKPHLGAALRALLPLVLLASFYGTACADPGTDRLETARTRLDQHRLPAANAVLQAQVKARPDRDEARLLLARVLSWQQRYDESLTEYRVLLEHKPDDATLRSGYARVLSWSGQHEAAIREFRKAIAADSTNL